MAIKCTLSGSMESIKYSAEQCGNLPQLPEYIVKKGPYINKQQGAAAQIVILYEFNRTRVNEAWRRVSEEMDTWHAVAGLTISAQIIEKT